jgi:HAD superfamily hydrolase (TIGR01549 family)
MFFKYVLFDLDNTLYSYNDCHEKALSFILEGISFKLKLSIDEIQDKYNSITKCLKNELLCTASCHNKGIYIKHLLEHYNIDLGLCVFYEKIYWKIFYENIKCYDGVYEFIQWLKYNNIGIVILTDYETEYQLEKLKHLKLLSFIDKIITSEEVGKEKPSKQMFLTALHKINAKPEEVIMVGDNYEKDILGAKNMNILPYYFNQQNPTGFLCVNKFTELHNTFINIHEELQKLEYISKYCGERFDLTQAGGGNTSVKFDDLMFIKASGYHLTQVTTCSGFVTIQNDNLRTDILNNKLKSITKYNLIGSLRGSIETYMHAILKKYTIHLHPIQVNKLLVSKQCEQFIKDFFPTSLLIEYDTPGINVCKKIINAYNDENIIFLKNHGIIITTDEYEKIIPMLESLLNVFETRLQINFNKYKYVNQISKCVNKNYENISYLCEDRTINEYLQNNKKLFQEKITFPDALIFCGLSVLFIKELKELDNYFEKYGEYPKVIVINELVYIINISLQKCKDTEDVLKGNLMIIDSDMEKTYLTNEEICYLNNWDAEKYRKTIS